MASRERLALVALLIAFASPAAASTVYGFENLTAGQAMPRFQVHKSFQSLSNVTLLNDPGRGLVARVDPWPAHPGPPPSWDGAEAGFYARAKYESVAIKAASGSQIYVDVYREPFTTPVRTTLISDGSGYQTVSLPDLGFSYGIEVGSVDPFYLDDITYYRPPEWSSVVPEPSVWAMMITGFAVAGTALRRLAPTRLSRRTRPS